MQMISQPVLNEIMSAVQLNDHGEAYVLAASDLNETALADRFRKINRRQLELGHLPYDLYHARQQAYQEMLKAAKSMLSTEGYRALYRVL